MIVDKLLEYLIMPYVCPIVHDITHARIICLRVIVSGLLIHGSFVRHELTRSNVLPCGHQFNLPPICCAFLGPQRRYPCQ